MAYEIKPGVYRMARLEYPDGFVDVNYKTADSGWQVFEIIDSSEGLPVATVVSFNDGLACGVRASKRAAAYVLDRIAERGW